MTGTLVLTGVALVILAATATRIKEARRQYRRELDRLEHERRTPWYTWMDDRGNGPRATP